ncbi:ComEC/Rec2 family competence protein [Gordonia insulae]|uniref:ComEC/Rec2-related protein domain-containing protein n=1 Tax=Gordonia insulae TaxID=2420509 RepID=A0A3G8JGF0_9ACTN|nr:hypothetical protein D7316_00085 [Gordonia insulae]
MATAAQLVTAPVVALLSGRFTVLGLLANIIVVPVVGLVGIAGTAAAVIGAVGGPDGLGAGIAELMIRALGPELWWMLTCARVLGGVSWAVVPVPSGVRGAVVVGLATVAAVFTIRVLIRWGEVLRRARRMGVRPVWHHGRRE